MINIDFSNENLKKMEYDKFHKNNKYASWYFNRAKKLSDDDIYYKRAVRISNCMDYFLWHKYEKNKILDLQKVNRCMNNRFCPNCKKLDLAKFIHLFSDKFAELQVKGYVPYFVTLTIPNCKFEDLSKTIDFLYKCFKKFWYGLYFNDRKGFSFRKVDFVAALKVLEVTTNLKNREFHPHLHCVFFAKKSISPDLLIKRYKGLWSTKRQTYDYYSDLDLHLKKLWTMICNGYRMSKKNYYNLNFDINELYQVDFRELDEKGLFEVLKYTFKDTDVCNEEIFNIFVDSFEGRRIRQGYGLLYNMKTENIDEGIYQELELEFDEDPTRLYTNEIKELYTKYSDYKKISRFCPKEFNYEEE